jgi:hypothetical protein
MIKTGSLRNLGINHTIITVEKCCLFCARLSNKMVILKECEFMKSFEILENFDVKVKCNCKK